MAGVKQTMLIMLILQCFGGFWGVCVCMTIYIYTLYIYVYIYVYTHTYHTHIYIYVYIISYKDHSPPFRFYDTTSF